MLCQGRPVTVTPFFSTNSRCLSHLPRVILACGDFAVGLRKRTGTIHIVASFTIEHKYSRHFSSSPKVGPTWPETDRCTMAQLSWQVYRERTQTRLFKESGVLPTRRWRLPVLLWQRDSARPTTASSLWRGVGEVSSACEMLCWSRVQPSLFLKACQEWVISIFFLSFFLSYFPFFLSFFLGWWNANLIIGLTSGWSLSGWFDWFCLCYSTRNSLVALLPVEALLCFVLLIMTATPANPPETLGTHTDGPQ